eukprot:349682-Chlamydomonas_euryale.AAC.26
MEARFCGRAVMGACLMTARRRPSARSHTFRMRAVPAAPARLGAAAPAPLPHTLDHAEDTVLQHTVE